MKSVLVGIGSIVFSSIVVIFFSTLPIEMVLQAATALIGIFVSSVCLKQIYDEHQVNQNKERGLLRSLFAKIHELDSNLTNFQAFTHFMNHCLESYTAETRLKKLSSFQNSEETLQQLILRFKQYQTSHHALKDLGLSW